MTSRYNTQRNLPAELASQAAIHIASLERRDRISREKRSHRLVAKRPTQRFVPNWPTHNGLAPTFTLIKYLPRTYAHIRLPHVAEIPCLSTYTLVNSSRKTYL
jgi:hypothetical protein